jgi:glycerophosphoryl diester phosphodiesterase
MVMEAIYSTMLCLVTINTPVHNSNPKIVGHRGSSYTQPENTLVSVKKAWAESADGVEVDIHLSKDGRIFVMHDASTKRTSGTDMLIRETSSEELRKLDVGSFKGKEFTGERMPYFEEVLATIPDGKFLLVEVKAGTEILPTLKRTIEESGKASQIAIIGFDLNTMTEFKKLIPKVPTYWLRGTDTNKETGKPIPHGLDLVKEVVKHKLDGLDLHFAGVDQGTVDAVRNAGLRLYIWTVNDPVEAQRLVNLGVDGITTDRPGWIKEQLKSIQSAK